MSRGEVIRYLELAALDRGFRERALADPAATLAGFDLDPVERDCLCRGDVSLLLPDAGPAPRPPPVAAGPPAGPQRLPPVELLLRLAALPQAGADGELHLQHLASLHPAAAAGAGPPADDKLPPGVAGVVSFKVTVTPIATPVPGGGASVGYRPEIAAVDPAGGEPAAPAASPWNHRTNSAAARQAAAAVLAAPPAERPARLLELIAVVTGGGARP